MYSFQLFIWKVSGFEDTNLQLTPVSGLEYFYVFFADYVADPGKLIFFAPILNEDNKMNERFYFYYYFFQSLRD